MWGDYRDINGLDANAIEMVKILGCVYMATSPSGNHYIGIAKDFRKRITSHRNDIKRGNMTSFKKAIIKYGWNNIVWEILYYSNDVNRLIEKEKYFINLYDTYRRGYNMNDGGVGNFSRSRESLIKEKITKGTNVEFNAFLLPNLTFHKSYLFARDCADDLGIKIHTIKSALYDKGEIKKAGEYYLTKDSIEYVNEHEDEILEYVFKKQRRKESYEKTGQYIRTREIKEKHSFAISGRIFSVKNISNGEEITTSCCVLISDLLGEKVANVSHWLRKYKAPIFKNGFEIVKIYDRRELVWQ